MPNIMTDDSLISFMGLATQLPLIHGNFHGIFRGWDDIFFSFMRWNGQLSFYGKKDGNQFHWHGDSTKTLGNRT